MILVTGAGGSVGGEGLKQLRVAGAPVRGAFHNAKKAGEAREQGIDSAVFDYADRGSIAAALKGVDQVFLVVATLPKQWELEQNVAEESKKAGVKHMVKLSVLDCDTEDYIFGRWHRAGERAIEAVGLPHTFLRPTGFMQNFVNFDAAIIKSQAAIYAPDESPHTAVDVRDIAAVAVKVLTGSGHEGKSYDLTGPAVLTKQRSSEDDRRRDRQAGEIRADSVGGVPARCAGRGNAEVLCGCAGQSRSAVRQRKSNPRER